MKMRGAKAVIDCLKREGTEVIFGYPGGSLLPIFDELYGSDIRFILVRHEQGAAHMADGYGRVTGRPGVCLATSGPGATNLVTGIATAYMDSSPLIALTGQVKSFLIGNDAFQEVDIIGITRPITKHNFLIKDTRLIPETIRSAFHIAGTGRPGPVLIDIPVDISTQVADFGPYPRSVAIRGYQPPLPPKAENLRAAAEAVSRSRRPLLYAGGGVNLGSAGRELAAFARRNRIPVTTTLNGLGSFPEDDPLSLKMLGMHGTMYANFAVQECDLLIAVGARFDDRVTGDISKFAPKAKIIHIDIDPSSISKNVIVDIDIIGDVKDVLQRLARMTRPPRTGAWLGHLENLKKRYPLRYKQNEKIAPQAVIEEIGRVTDHAAVIATGVGQHQMWTAQWYGFRHPRQFVTSGGLGTMGFGLPASIGAQIGSPGKTVFCIDGDGSIQMTMMELVTAAYYKVPVKVAILDNNYLGMVRQWQELFYGKRYSGVYLGPMNPDFIRLAEGFGILGMRVERPEEVRPTLERALAHEGPVLMQFCVAPEENVYPMVPAGQPLDNMIELA
jgi:acetolactate synthase-1/2/3 large subunit